ncbi:hypothetical protein [Thalassotalea sp. ND16A]|uniref:hypothetical protein n=1 Tax=Thalassotalea sp. ND16A TaxID=1535422 RepID=UPI00051A111F|nr:hypothetical protein [Thalassotalea sp. ND16A]KGJ87458.1 hypothetical protein ND16A_2841 [Thalassotalea sp. ND16A]
MKSIFKVVKWFCLIALGLPLFFYLLWIAINIADQDYSQSSIAKIKTIQQLPTNVRADNAHSYALGLSSETPLKTGMELANAIAKQTNFSAAVATTTDAKTIRIINEDEIKQVCFRQDKKFCQADKSRPAFYVNSAQVTQLLAENRKIIANYQQLINFTYWQETAIASNVTMSYRRLLVSQKLYLMVVGQKLALVDRHITKSLLDMDIRFWRMVLSSTNSLMTKMICREAIERHFLLLQQLLSPLADEHRQALIPEMWRTMISDDERSFTKVMLGEWGNLQKLLSSLDTYQDSDIFEQLSTFEQLGTLALKPLFKVNATLNRHGNYLDVYSQQSSLDYSVMKHSLAVPVNSVVDSCPKQFSASYVYWLLYNPVGKIMSCSNPTSLAEYIIRVTDLEAVRRLTLLSLELDIEHHNAQQQQHIVNETELRDPYTEQVFVLDRINQTIGFIGFQTPGFSSDRIEISLQ